VALITFRETAAERKSNGSERGQEYSAATPADSLVNSVLRGKGTAVGSPERVFKCTDCALEHRQNSVEGGQLRLAQQWPYVYIEPRSVPGLPALSPIQWQVP
jgi:hypothetical protein